MASPKIKIKLLVDTYSEKVVFAEAGKDFIDFLIHLLSLPLATAVRLLNEKTMDVGSLGHLHESLQNLPDSYWQPDQSKNSLLNPPAPICTTGIPLIMSDNDFVTRKWYKCPSYCSSCSSYITDVPKLQCPECISDMTKELSYVPSRQGGFIIGLVTYIVMDNLEFKPMSTKMFVSLLNKFDFRDVSALEVIEVELGIKEVLKLLKLSLESKTVLTSFYHDVRSKDNFLSLKYGGHASISTELVEMKDLNLP